MASGMARGAAARGKQIAFGNGRKIIWDQNSEAIFHRNPNVARPGTERSGRIEWIPFYRGNRLYNRQAPDRWIWNYEFKPRPGEIFLAREEIKFADRIAHGCVVIEPNVPSWKSVAPNKQWPVERYQQVADLVLARGHDVVQLNYERPGVRGGGYRLAGVRHIRTVSFRYGLAVLARSALYIGPEGGLHHGAAAFGIPAVVLFGGFIPPQVTGYDTHTNLTGGAEACGSLTPCQHCRDAMGRISVEEVDAAAAVYLKRPMA